MDGFVGVIAAFAALWLILWLYILLPWRMAEKRGRSGCLWVVISVLFSPILAVLLLLALG